MDGTSTPVPTGTDVDKHRAFLARHHERETIDEVLEHVGAEFTTQWQLADLAYGRAVEVWGRLPTEGETREIWMACAEPAQQAVSEMDDKRRQALAASAEAAPIMESVHAFFAACHERPRSAMGPRRVRVRTRTRERRSSPAARRTSSSASSGSSSDEPGPGDEPPGDDVAARPSGGAA